MKIKDIGRACIVVIGFVTPFSLAMEQIGKKAKSVPVLVRLSDGTTDMSQDQVDKLIELSDIKDHLVPDEAGTIYLPMITMSQFKFLQKHTCALFFHGKAARINFLSQLLKEKKLDDFATAVFLGDVLAMKKLLRDAFEAFEMNIVALAYADSEVFKKILELPFPGCKFQTTRPVIALLHFCSLGRVDIAELLLGFFDWPLKQNILRRELVSRIIEGGNVAMLKTIFDAHLDEMTPELIVAAAHNGRTDFMAYVLESCHPWQNLQASLVKALFESCQYGHGEIVGLLLNFCQKRGITILESRNESDHTPLMVASQNKYSDIVDLLLQAGADLHAKKGTLDAAPFWLGVSSGSKSVVQKLYNSCNDLIFERDQDGRTPLFFSSGSVMRFLVKNGASVHVVDNRNETVLAYKLWAELSAQDREDFEWLVKKGARLDVTSEEGWSLFSRASLVVSSQAEWFFRTFKPNIREVDNEGYTILMRVCKDLLFFDRPAIAKILFDARANPNTQRAQDGCTALMYAVGPKVLDDRNYYDCLGGDLKVVELLLENDAQLDIKDAQGMTALMWAVERCASRVHESHKAEHDELDDRDMSLTIIRLLLAKGARKDLRDNKGRTAHMIAEHYSDKELSDLLFDQAVG